MGTAEFNQARPRWLMNISVSAFLYVETERDTVIALRNDESINDEVLRRIQHDIDLAEARRQWRR